MQYLLWPLSEQFQNKNGSILTNGKVYVYYRGRTSLATTWSDEDGTVENSQPIILDDNGRAACYVNPAYYYTVVVCDFYGKELFSYDISLHDGTGTGDNNIEITSSDHSILIDKTSIIDGYRYDEKVNPEFVAEVAVSAVSDLIPNYWNNDRTIVIDDSSKEIKTDMQSVMIRQQINNSYYDYKYAKICEADINTITWINEWMTTLQLSFQSNGAYYTGKSSGIFVLNCENYVTQSGYSQRHEEDGKWLLFDKDNSSPQISKLYLYWRNDSSSQHYELWGEFNNLKYYEGVGVAALINCSLRNHLTSSLPIEQERNIWRFNPIGIESLKDSLPTDAGSLVKTFDPADADIKPIAEPDPGTFYATYVYDGPASGNTSFEDIKAAYDAGKSVYVNYKQNLSDYETEVYSLVSFRDTPRGRPDLSCFFFTNLDQGTGKTIYRFPSNWGKMSDRTFALSDNLVDLTQSIAQDDYFVPIPSPSGVYCTRNYEVYKAIEPITSNTWVASAWTKVTVMDEVLSLVSSTSGTTDVFIAKYMVTPVSSVFEAVDEGKFVWVSLGSDGHGPYLPMNVTSTTEGSTSYVRFEGLNYYNYGSGNDGTQVLMTAANTTGWEAVSTTNIAPKEFVLSTVSGASSILESEIQVVSAAIDSASGGNFLAIYQSTPASAIYDALDAGKNVMVSLNSDGSGVYLRTNSYTKGASYSDSRAYFIGTLSFGENNVTQGRVYLDGETWSPVEYTALPSVDNIGTMISNTVSAVSSVLEIDIQTVSSAIETISGQNGVFIAEYGTTTFEEIGEAVADGKAVFGKGHPYNSDMLLPIASFTSPRPSIAIFSGIIGNYQYSIKLDGTTWSNETITLAKNEDVVNADWDATSGKAEILNRPEIVPVSAGTGIIIEEVSGVTLISTSGAGTEDVFWALYGTTPIDQIAAARSAGKVVKITRGSGADIFYGDLTDYAFGTYYFTFFDRGGNEVYTASVIPDGAAGTWTWSAKTIPDAQVNADWEAVSGVAEILNKPEFCEVSGGTGIDIQNVSGTIVISSTGGPNYEAGQYISIVNDQISATGLVDQSTYNTDTAKYESAYSTVESNSAIWNETQVNSDWEATSGVTEILNKPSIVPISGGTGITIEKVNDTLLISSSGSGGMSTVVTTSNLKGDGSSSNPLDLNSVIDIGGYPNTSHHTFINDMGIVSGMNIAPEYYGWAITPISGLTIHSKYDDEGTTGPNNYLIGRDIIALHGIETSASIWNEAAAMDEYPVSAGPGMSIEDVDGVTVFQTSGTMMNDLIEYNSQDEISGYNGHPVMTVDSEKQWLTHDDTIAHVTNSAQYAFGVNVPVVAQAMGTDETELWSSTTLASSAVLSEPLTNFEFIEIYTRSADNGYQAFKYTTVEGPVNLTYFKGNNYPVMIMAQITFSGSTVSVSRTLGLAYTWGSTNIPSVARANNNDDKNILIKIVGIGRKENT